jgi:hypothetical protein
MSADREIRVVSSARKSARCERQLALRQMKRVLRDGVLDARTALLLSASVIELERDPASDPRAMLARNQPTLLANA